MIAYVFIPKRTGRSQKRSRPEYSARYKFPWMVTMQQICLHTTDRRVADQKLAEIIREAEYQHSGILPPKTLQASAQRPINDHVQDFIQDLTARGRSPKYIRNTRMWMTRLIKECTWPTITDVTPQSFIQWRTGQHIAPKTMNEYLGTANGFFNWLQRNNQILANPLKPVDFAKTRGREVRKRRALTDDEVGRLLAASQRHRPVYLLALLTGLRRGEITALQCGDVHLDTSPPYITVRASTTKNSSPATIFLRDDLAAALRQIIKPAYPPNRQLFHRLIPRMPWFRADLARAHIAEIDAQGRRVDFHALRHTFCTNLARAGVPPRSAMSLMRHSDMRMTNTTYTDESQLSLSEQINKLPRWDQVPPPTSQPSSLKIVSQTGDVSSHFEAQTGTIDSRKARRGNVHFHAKNGLKTHISDDSNPGQKNSAGRTRTYNKSVNSRLLYH